MQQQWNVLELELVLLPCKASEILEPLKRIQGLIKQCVLRKTCQNTRFLLPLISRIRTEYGRKKPIARAQECTSQRRPVFCHTLRISELQFKRFPVQLPILQITEEVTYKRFSLVLQTDSQQYTTHFSLKLTKPSLSAKH